MITVELVRREDVNDPNQYFEASVEELGVDLAVGQRWLRVIRLIGIGLVSRVLYCQYYFITAITCDDTEQAIKAPFAETYSTKAASQRLAFLALDSLFKNKQGKTTPTEGKERTVQSEYGPVRIEILLKERHKVTPPMRMVVLGLEPPKGHFSTYAVTGRVWAKSVNGTGYSGSDDRLGANTETYWSDSYVIVKIEQILNNATTSTQTFNINENASAWTALANALKKLLPREFQLLRAWKPHLSPTSARRVTYQGSDYTQSYGTWGGTGHAQEPKVAEFRVAGDEIGAVLYRKQEENAKKVLTEDQGPAGDQGGSGDLPDETASEELEGCEFCGELTCPPESCASYPGLYNCVGHYMH